MTRIAWATGADYAAIDADLPLLTDAAGRRGLSAEAAVWDDPSVDWAAYDLVVVRSCWDYVPRRAEFLQWARGVPRLANPAAVIEWNTDKRYLRELEERGIAIVETRWSVRAGDDLPPTEPGAEEWVVKPTISAGSADTARWSDPERVYEHSERLLDQGRQTMVQPYLASVDTDGETGLLFYGGRFAHAFRKGAILVPGTDPRDLPEVEEDISARDPSAESIAFGDAVVAAATDLLGQQPLYARVDVATDPAGGVRLMELELAEPSFFVDHSDGGADAFADALVARLEASV